MDKDKYGIVLDIVEHPDRYNSEQLQEILSDPETREVYNLLCKVDSAVEAGKEPDVEAEWKRFAQKHDVRPRRRYFMWFGSRAASIAAIAATSIVAVAAGIALTVAVTERKSEPMKEGPSKTAAVVRTIAPAVTGVPADSITVRENSVMFEDESLETIMNEVASAYGVEVVFDNKEASGLRLYYKLNPSLPLDEVVSQLNTFEQINITLKDNTLTVE